MSASADTLSFLKKGSDPGDRRLVRSVPGQVARSRLLYGLARHPVVWISGPFGGARVAFECDARTVRQSFRELGDGFLAQDPGLHLPVPHGVAARVVHDAAAPLSRGGVVLGADE